MRPTQVIRCRYDLQTITMKAIVVTDQAAGMAGMKLVKRPEPQAAINDVVVEVHASGFVPAELAWPSTWTDRLGRDRTPSVPGQELAGVVSALGYGTTGLSVGQRVFGLTDSYRGGTLAEYVAIEARNLAPLPGDVDFTVGASLPISGLTAWQGLFDHGHLQAGQTVLAHGAAGAVGTMVTQLAREAGAYVIGTASVGKHPLLNDLGIDEAVDYRAEAFERAIEPVDLVLDLIGGEVAVRSLDVLRRRAGWSACPRRPRWPRWRPRPSVGSGPPGCWSSQTATGWRNWPGWWTSGGCGCWSPRRSRWSAPRWSALTPRYSPPSITRNAATALADSDGYGLLRVRP